MRPIKYLTLINSMCLLLPLFIFSAQTNFGKGFYVQSRSIDNQDFCQLKLYRRQYFTDPKPKAIEHNSRHLRIYQVKSVRSIGTYSNINWGLFLRWIHFLNSFYKNLNYKFLFNFRRLLLGILQETQISWTSILFNGRQLQNFKFAEILQLRSNKISEKS